MSDFPLLSPFVYWGQSKEHIYLRVDIEKAKNISVDLSENSVSFAAIGDGSRGTAMYKFSITFLHSIDKNESFWQTGDRDIQFKLAKTSFGVWSRLTESTVKLSWLRIDFDKFDFSDEDDKPEILQTPGLDKMMETLKKETAKITFPGRQMYLVSYNSLQFFHFFVALFCLFRCLFRGQQGELLTLAGAVYNEVMPYVHLGQTFALLEILNAFIGVVHGSCIPTVAQVLGRNFVVIVLHYAEDLHNSSFVIWLLLAWCSIEVIRYPFYLLQALSHPQKWVSWLRYTLWIPLYPLGIVCEAMVLLKAIPLYQQSNALSLPLPNAYNISFYMDIFLHLYLVLFVPAAVLQLSFMSSQRRKKLK